MVASGKKKVLIVHTNGGGHAVTGFYFVKEHLSNGHQVTVLTVGDKVSDKMKNPPSDSRKLFEHLTLSSFQIRPHKNEMKTNMAEVILVLVTKQPEESLSTEKCDSSTEAATGYDEQQISINKTLSGLEAPKDMETYSFEECGSLVIEHLALDCVLGPMRESEETLDGSDFERQCCLVLNSPVRSGMVW